MGTVGHHYIESVFVRSKLEMAHRMMWRCQQMLHINWEMVAPVGVLQGCHQRGQFDASAAGSHDGVQIVDIIAWLKWFWNWPGMADGGESGSVGAPWVIHEDSIDALFSKEAKLFHSHDHQTSGGRA